ncbi:MAG: tetratricopeptide repeat protein [Caldilineaceae bacterium]|nr:tetratricopeptide repeat protein [Caldilineaceae bacterium]
MDNSLAALESRLQNTVNLLERIDLLNQIGETVRYTDSERMLAVATEAQMLLDRSPRQSRPYLRSYGISLELLGYYYFLRGDFETAYDHYQSAIHYFIQIYDDASRCYAWTYSCLCQTYLGRWADAMEEAVACLDLAVAIGDRISESKLWLVMGTTYARSGDHMRSIDAFSKALQIAKEIQEPQEQIAALRNLADAYIGAGQYADGVIYANQALALSQEHHIQLEIGHILFTLAQGYYGQKNFDDALETYRQCYECSPQSEALRAKSLMGQGQVYLAWQRSEEALTHLLQALPLIQATQVQPEWCECHQALADAYAQQGDWRNAYQHQMQFHRCRDTLFNTQSDLRLKMLEVTFRTEEAYRQADQSQRQAQALEAQLKQKMRELKTQIEAEVERRRRGEDEKNNLIDVARKQGEQLQNLTQWMVSQQLPHHQSTIRALFEGYSQNIQLLAFHIDAAMQKYQGANAAELDASMGEQLNLASAIIKQIQNTMRSIANKSPDDEPQSFMDSAGLVHLLSNRERDVLRLLAQGESTKEISQMLHVTEGTVRTYRYRIMQKLDITDVARLIHFAVRHQDAL